ncbi:HupE/UreJ family protein [Mesorhizobium sp. 10J20-29]
MTRRLAFAAIASLAAASPAFAHPGALDRGSLAAGMAHPFLGLDHVLAMLAVGLWASLLGAQGEKRVVWLVPAAFVGAMAVGFVLALSGLALPFVEPTILASVVVLGLLAAAAYTVPVGAGMALVASFALFHGYAHGGELGGANVLVFGLGFAVSTALLHLAGIGLGRLLGSSTGRILIRFMGGATAVAGLVMAMGA